jgi:hypothetical protein
MYRDIQGFASEAITYTLGGAEPPPFSAWRMMPRVGKAVGKKGVS